MSRFAQCVRLTLQEAADPSVVRFCALNRTRSRAHQPVQANVAQRATSALQALERTCDAVSAAAVDGAPRSRLALDEMRSAGEPVDDLEQDLEPDEYDASSGDDADDAAYCMLPAA